MPITPTYPGVYIEELPSPVQTITGVSTAVTAFIGWFSEGPLNTPVQVFSVADVERNFGSLVANSEAGYSLRQFFANGGAEAWVVRVGQSTKLPALAQIVVESSSSTPLLTVSAASPGAWGNSIRLLVDYATSTPGSGFNLTVIEVDSSNPPNVVATEVYRNLSLDSTSSNYAPAVVNAGSALVNLQAQSGVSATDAPAATGTFGSDISGLSLPLGLPTNVSMKVTLGSTTVDNIGFTSSPATLTDIAPILQQLLRTKGFPTATVSLVPGAGSAQQLQVQALTTNATDTFTFDDDESDGLATRLGLTGSGIVTNVVQYTLGAQTVAGFEGVSGTGGADGGQPDATGILGDPLAKTGMYSLANAPGFNILCIPDVMNLPDSDASAVISAAETYCQANWAFLIVDVPQSPTGGVGGTARDSMSGIQAWMAANNSLRSSYAALYFPRPQIPDPLNSYRLRAVAGSGTMAGLYAQTDGSRGVWKAPAGTTVTLGNVPSLTYQMSDAENGVLNPLAINCLRTFPVYGNVSWGARTLDGADQLESQWKYIPVRRLALYLEASLYQGTQWVVFEPNDEELWSQIRLNVGTFMQGLFLQGAFEGTTPQSAYLVKCDSDTTTQADINNGVVNIIVGFAPLQPAEFVILQIEQLAGQSAS